MPSLCSGLVTRIPGRPELVRPKRGTANGGDVATSIIHDGLLSPPFPSPEFLERKEEGARPARFEARTDKIVFRSGLGGGCALVGREKVMEFRHHCWLHRAKLHSEFLIARPSHIGARNLNG